MKDQKTQEKIFKLLQKIHIKKGILKMFVVRGILTYILV